MAVSFDGKGLKLVWHLVTGYRTFSFTERSVKYKDMAAILFWAGDAFYSQARNKESVYGLSPVYLNISDCQYFYGLRIGTYILYGFDTLTGVIYTVKKNP